MKNNVSKQMPLYGSNQIDLFDKEVMEEYNDLITLYKRDSNIYLVYRKNDEIKYVNLITTLKPNTNYKYVYKHSSINIHFKEDKKFISFDLINEKFLKDENIFYVSLFSDYAVYLNRSGYNLYVYRHKTDTINDCKSLFVDEKTGLVFLLTSDNKFKLYNFNKETRNFDIETLNIQTSGDKIQDVEVTNNNLYKIELDKKILVYNKDIDSEILSFDRDGFKVSIKHLKDPDFNNIYVLDENNKVIHVYDTMGNFLYKTSDIFDINDEYECFKQEKTKKLTIIFNKIKPTIKTNSDNKIIKL